jgi:hypothetical protein
MTQDTKSFLALLSERFTNATKRSFDYLEKEGFIRCEAAASDLSEYRDAALVQTYIRGSGSLDVRIEIATLQITVTFCVYALNATCVRVARPLRVSGLDGWTEQHWPVAPPPLPWMKTKTFYREVERNYRYFFKHVDQDLDGAVEFMAERLRNSQLYNVDV